MDLIMSDLKKKMVFLSGPRQIGKTWLAKEIMKKYKNPVYLNYDSVEDKQIILKRSWYKEADIVVFDELHKMKNWKNYLKGIFDTKLDSLHILVTGSARLEVFKKAGDSLAGRYFTHHLLPFSLEEVTRAGFDKDIITDKIIERGGFPEPFLAEKTEDAMRWRNQYSEALIKQDVFDISRIFDMNAIKEVFDRLRVSVGSCISYQSIAEDVGISAVTVKKYIQILESVYIIFQIKPFTHKILRSIKKEPKVYFFDNGMVYGDKGAVFENAVAVALYTKVMYSNDSLGTSKNLHYIKTKDGKEADFLIADKNIPETIYEAKESDHNLSKNLIYFTQKYGVKGIQVVHDLEKENSYVDMGIDIIKYTNL
jgi:predicted AAA+ superfamily ATPase